MKRAALRLHSKVSCAKTKFLESNCGQHICMSALAGQLQATFLTVTDEEQALIGQMPHLDPRVSFKIFFFCHLSTYPPIFHICQSAFYSGSVYLNALWRLTVTCWLALVTAMARRLFEQLLLHPLSCQSQKKPSQVHLQKMLHFPSLKTTPNEETWFWRSPHIVRHHQLSCKKHKSSTTGLFVTDTRAHSNTTLRWKTGWNRGVKRESKT